ncbi:unnamed protein product [Camellia sinensis]
MGKNREVDKEKEKEKEKESHTCDHQWAGTEMLLAAMEANTMAGRVLCLAMDAGYLWRAKTRIGKMPPQMQSALELRNPTSIGKMPNSPLLAHTDADESMKRTIMASFGKKWRDWKSRVKTMGYKPFKNDAERLAHRPDRVHEDQWRALVYYWGTQSASKSSKKNRKIRKKKTLHHRTGRKPFSVVRLEETKKNNGVPASRSQVWMAAYMKDGTANSDSVNEVMTQMNELAEHMEGSSTDPAALQEQIFTQIMGPERPGRVRTFGLGPSPTDVFGGGYRRSQEQNRLFQTQVQEQVQEQLQRYQMQFESKMNEVMEKQIQAIRTDFQSRIQFLESQLQAAGVPVDPVVAPSNPLHRQQVVDSLSSHPTVRPMSHQQQSHAFSSQEFTFQRKRRRIRRRRRTNKAIWRGIIAIDDQSTTFQEIYLNNYQLKVGDGRRIIFWTDKWCNHLSFKDEFPGLYRLSSKKSATLKDIFDRKDELGVWNLAFRRELYDWEEGFAYGSCLDGQALLLMEADKRRIERRLK